MVCMNIIKVKNLQTPLSSQVRFLVASLSAFSMAFFTSVVLYLPALALEQVTSYFLVCTDRIWKFLLHLTVSSFNTLTDEKATNIYVHKWANVPWRQQNDIPLLSTRSLVLTWTAPALPCSSSVCSTPLWGGSRRSSGPMSFNSSSCLSPLEGIHNSQALVNIKSNFHWSPALLSIIFLTTQHAGGPSAVLERNTRVGFSQTSSSQSPTSSLQSQSS